MAFTHFANKESKCNSAENLSKDLYQLYFDSLSVQRFRDLYGYLNNTGSILYSDYVDDTRLKSPNEIILSNYYNLSMEPYAAMFTGRKDIGVKVVKIKDFKWFPHLRPELYSSEIIRQLENKFGWKRKNFDNLLPFI